MQKTPRFHLRIGSKKDRCPACGRMTFKPYRDATDGRDMTDGSGRCDREMKCGYHKPPDKTMTPLAPPYRHHAPSPVAPPPPVYIPDAVNEWMMTNAHHAGFLTNLINHVAHRWNADDVWTTASKYRLGAIPPNQFQRYGHALTLPFIDVDGRVHAVMVKTFDRQNHTIGHPNWIHKIMMDAGIHRDWLMPYDQQPTKTRCLFGEHLIVGNAAPIAIVEAPKTAIICDWYFRELGFVWLAVGAKSWLKPDRCHALVGRRVILFPDTSTDGATFADWTNKAIEIRRRITDHVTVSDMMERYATPEMKSSGADIADILMTMDWRLFRKSGTDDKPDDKLKKNQFKPVETSLLDDAALIEHLKNIKPNDEALRMSPHTTITDQHRFLMTNIAAATTYVSGVIHDSYMRHLRAYANVIMAPSGCI